MTTPAGLNPDAYSMLVFMADIIAELNVSWPYLGYVITHEGMPDLTSPWVRDYVLSMLSPTTGD